MPIEISAGAVIFRKEDGKIYYLLLRYPAMNHRSGKDYWDFVKGHIERGEKVLETIKRETKEEAGLNDLEFVDGFSQTMKYFFVFEGKKIFKIVNFKLAQTKTKDIKLSDEHNDFIWLPFDQACEALSFDNAKNVLKKANVFLENQE
jgi:8-oxo-dGTP pyrophosphatase MutT (NUDIX family)